MVGAAKRFVTGVADDRARGEDKRPTLDVAFRRE